MSETVRIGGYDFPADQVISERAVLDLDTLAGAGGSLAEDHFATSWHMLGLAPYEREISFHPARRWRFDFAWPAARVAVEVEGGIWSAGPSRHLTGAGFIEDAEKYNAAAALGWCVQRWPTDWIGHETRGRWVDTFDAPRAEELDRLIGTRAVGLSVSLPADLDEAP